MESLILMWKHPETKKNYVIGSLTKNTHNHYMFVYHSDKVKLATDNGFELLIGFPALGKTYYSDKLFPVFERRIPPKGRKDFKKVIEKYKLNIYPDIIWEFLKITSGKTGTDTFYFVNPITIFNKHMVLDFNIAGWSFSENIDHLLTVIKQDDCAFEIKAEPENEVDPYAVAIYAKTKDQEAKVGYIPNPFNFPIADLLEINAVKCSIELVTFLDFDNNRPVFRITGLLQIDIPKNNILRYSPYIVWK